MRFLWWMVLTNKHRMSKLVEFVSKVAVPEHTKNLIFEVCVDDQDGEDVEVPFVCIKLR